MSSPDEHDALMAVVAHGLLGSLAVVSGAALTLRDFPDLPAEKRAELHRMLDQQTEHMAEVLRDLIRGVPPELRHALDSLSMT